MEIMIVTFSGLFVLAILVAILHWIDGRKPDGNRQQRRKGKPIQATTLILCINPGN